MTDPAALGLRVQRETAARLDLALDRVTVLVETAPVRRVTAYWMPRADYRGPWERVKAGDTAATDAR